MPIVCKRTKKAKQDLAHVTETIAKDNPQASIDTVIRVVRLTEEQLSSDPKLGRAGRNLGTRKLVIASKPYIIVYRLADNLVTILKVFHSAQQWPKL